MPRPMIAVGVGNGWGASRLGSERCRAQSSHCQNERGKVSTFVFLYFHDKRIEFVNEKRVIETASIMRPY